MGSKAPNGFCVLSGDMRDNRKTNKNIFVVVNCGNITIQRVTNKIEGQYSKIRFSVQNICLERVSGI